MCVLPRQVHSGSSEKRGIYLLRSLPVVLWFCFVLFRVYLRVFFSLVLFLVGRGRGLAGRRFYKDEKTKDRSMRPSLNDGIGI